MVFGFPVGFVPASPPHHTGSVRLKGTVVVGRSIAIPQQGDQNGSKQKLHVLHFEAPQGFE